MPLPPATAPARSRSTRANRSAPILGIRPASWSNAISSTRERSPPRSSPQRVYVFPVPVCPYAMTPTSYPSHAARRAGSPTAAYTSSWVSSSSHALSKVKSSEFHVRASLHATRLPAEMLRHLPAPRSRSMLVIGRTRTATRVWLTTSPPSPLGSVMTAVPILARLCL